MDSSKNNADSENLTESIVADSSQVSNATSESKHPKLENGIALVTKAVDFDKNHQYEEALQFYKDGIKCLMEAFKCDTKTVREKDMLKNKLRQYIDRATVLKKHLEKEPENVGCQNADLKNNVESFIWDLPKVTFDDIIGHQDVKDWFKEWIVLPMRYPELFRGLRPESRSCLLFGAPGTGKTKLAKSLATETGNVTCLFVSADYLVSQWTPDGERVIKDLFTYARKHKPSLIFIDDIDRLCECEYTEGTRRVKTEFLVQYHDNEDVRILAATNRPLDLDNSLRKRFCKRIYVPLPNGEERSKLIEMYLGNNCIKHSLSQEDVDAVSEKTNGYTSPDILQLVQDAKMKSIFECQKSTHFRKVVKPNTTEMENIAVNVSEYTKQQTETTAGHNQSLSGPEICGQHDNNTDEHSDDLSISHDIFAPNTRSYVHQLTFESMNHICEHCILQAYENSGQETTKHAKSNTSEDIEECYGYEPCDAESPGAIRMSLCDISEDKLITPPICLEHFMVCLEKCKPSVETEQIEMQLQFKRDFVDY